MADDRVADPRPLEATSSGPNLDLRLPGDDGQSIRLTSGAAVATLEALRRVIHIAEAYVPVEPKPRLASGRPKA